MINCYYVKRLFLWILCGLLILWLISACGSAQKNASEQLAYDPASKVPPTAKEALQIMMRNHDIPLTVHASCKGVGTDFDDSTIGDYISGFLGEMTGPSNSVTVTCVPSINEHDSRKVWRCEILLRHADEEDEWRWGVRFDVDQKTGLLIRSSVRCIGMG